MSLFTINVAQKTEYVHKHRQTDREKRGEMVDSKAIKEKLSTSQLDELVLYCRAWLEPSMKFMINDWLA